MLLDYGGDEYLFLSVPDLFPDNRHIAGKNSKPTYAKFKQTLL
jgi:hypothetical protein